MQLDWIESFLAVVRHRGFAAASIATFRSQPRVSAHIASLESDLNAALFDRSQRPVALTHAGRAFLQYALTIETTLVTAREEVSSFAEGLDESVSVGTYASAGARFLPGVLARFRDAHPLVTVTLVEQAVVGLDEAMSASRVALMVRPMSPVPAVPRVHSAPLWRERMHLVVSANHRLASRDQPIGVTELQSETLVVAGAGTEGEAFRLLRGRGVQFQLGYVSDQPLTQLALVRAGLGSGFLNALALQGEDFDGLRVLDIDDPGLVRDVGLFWTDDLYGSRAATMLQSIMLHADPPHGTSRLPRPADERPADGRALPFEER